jgi:hypothetical protein
MPLLECRCRLKSVPTALRRLSLKLLCLLVLHLSCGPASAVLRDCWYGQFDPANVGTGAWLYILSSATNQLGGNVPGVTNVDSMFAYIKSQGMQHVIVKAGTSNMLWTGSGNVSTNNTAAAQFSPTLVQKAHAAGLLIFGSNRSYGSDLDGENNVAKYVFSVGGDGFIWDAEAEWEAGHPGITNGPAQAWYMCSQLRAAFPTKFLAHNPFDTLYIHSSFPYREFGYWADVVIPQVYHHAATKGSASAAINWTDTNYNAFHANLVGTSSVINGQTIYWTNSIKPVWYMREIYNGTSGTTATPPNDITEFVDYMMADVNCPSPVPFNSANWFRVELYSPTQWTKVKEATVGFFSNVVNNICIDEASATFVGSWTSVTTVSCNTNASVTFLGETGTDTNAFGISYRKKTSGSGSAYAQFSPKVLVAGDYNVFQWHPFRADASANVPVVVNCATGAQTVYANQTTNAGIWSFVGRFPFGSGTTTIRMTDATLDGNVSVADGLKLMFVYPTSVPATPSGLTAVAASSSQINLTWSDNATNEAGVSIGRSSLSGGPFTDIANLPVNATTYSDTNLAENATYYYRVRATNYLGTSANSTQASATTLSSVPTAPSFSAQPQSQTVTAGNGVAFSAAASGTPIPTYQWRLNGTNIAGATNTSYSNADVEPGDAGTYTLIASNAVNTATSSDAVLTVIIPTPTISQQPQSQSQSLGGTANFSVTAGGGAPLRYQWRFNDVEISGASNFTYSRSDLTTNDAGIYSVVVTNNYGSITSSPATLSVILTKPSITAEPQNQTVMKGKTTTITVNAVGSPTLLFQWNFNGVPIAGATKSSLVMTNISTWQAGSYFVTVSNDADGVVSATATVVVNPPFHAIGWTKLWSAGGGSRPYLASTAQTDRGLAYSASSNHVLVVSRSPSTAIYVLDGDTGADLWTLNTSSPIITGGTYPLLMIGASDDGVIYAGNLTTAGTTTPFRLYSWTNDTSTATPSAVFSADPAPADNERWGDTLVVRGSGTNTQVLIGSRSGRSVVLLAPGVGGFNARWINTANSASGNFGLGLAFGADNTFWGKANTLPLVNVAHNFSTGTVITNYSSFSSTIAPIGMSVEMNLLAGIALDPSENLRLYDLTLTNGAPVLLAQTNFATANINAFATGSIAFGNKRVYALDSNNGILAMQIIPAVEPVQCESVSQLPDGRIQIMGSGNPGSTNLIQRSTNLVDWTTVNSFLNTNGSWRFFDDPTQSGEQSFYRAAQ